MVRGLLCCLSFVGLTGAGTAAAMPQIDISDLSHQTLYAPAEFQATEPGTTLAELDPAAFRPLTASDTARGITDRVYWIRARFVNSGEEAVTWILSHETAYLDNLTVWTAPAGQPAERVDLSDRRVFADRQVPYRKLAVRHRTEAGSFTDVYLRLGYEKPDAMSLNLHLATEGHFLDRVLRENLVQGVYFGVMMLLLALALLGAVVLRQIVYVYYAAFLLLSGLMWAMLNGYAFQYLWPESVFWHNEGIHIVFLLVAIAALQFSKGFLHTRDIMPRVHRGLTGLQLLFAGGILLRFAGFYESVHYLAYGALSLLAVLPVLGYFAWKQGYRYARWYAVAWLVYSAGLILSVLTASSSLFTWGMQPLIYAQAGSMVEAMLLLVALGERLRGWEQDRRDAIRLANHDPLTGLGNRRRLAQAHEQFVNRFRRNGQPVFLMLIDLDHFKTVNDQYGHDAGDEVLRSFAALLLRLSRPEDVCIRYGGEEFALLFQADSVQSAAMMCERIRLEFADMAIQFDGQVIRNTLSAGLAVVMTADEMLEPEAMIQRVDVALYRAKVAGRNNTMVYDRSQENPVPGAASARAAY